MSADQEYLEVRGAREHNLKNLSVRIPRNKFTVITGLSGSGKSSLAFDTIYAEGQRRYLESLSSYARQFLEKLKKPDVDHISGLSPSISIEQRSATHNPRSTVATVTEIYDYLRLLFSKVGTAHCPSCGLPMRSQTRDELARDILVRFGGHEVQVLAPLVRGRKGEYQKLFQDMLKKGYDRARIDGTERLLAPEMKLKKTVRHDIGIIVDELVLKENKEDKRFRNSLACALDLAGGQVAILDRDVAGQALHYFSTTKNCLSCQISLPELTPNMFSFNSPYGACPKCKGLGKLSQVFSKGVIADPKKALMQALNKEVFFSFNKYFFEDLLHDLSHKYDFEWDTPYGDWPETAKEAFFLGDGDIAGLVEEWERLFHETDSDMIRAKIRKFLREETCKECGGKRLRKESLGVSVAGKNIAEVTSLLVEDAAPYFEALSFSGNDAVIAAPILHEIRERLAFLLNIGLGYLTLDRTVATLAGGELQRIRLAAQISLGLTGVLYVLDEPSIGLHPRDNEKLLDALERLRDLKNTVLVVEHDEETIRRADHVIDLGPGSGAKGGEIVAQGAISEMKDCPRSVTLKYLHGELSINVPEKRKDYRNAPKLLLKKCAEHNLKEIDVEIPLGLFTCVTGVSGSGKSTLVHDILYRELHNRLWKTGYKAGDFGAIEGAELIDRVIGIDQTPIGRTPRSNPATYTDMFGFIRRLFSSLEIAKLRRYSQSRFSFNLKGGRCEKCRGAGFEKLEMSFMPDLYVVCEDCRGKRYNAPTLEVRYQGKNIAEVLDLSIRDAKNFFSKFAMMREKLEVLDSIGLGYVKLGQPSTTLSGGEAQRIKIASELMKKSTGRTLYLLDEPTTGLHFADIKNLLKALFDLRNQGNTIVVIEHNLDVIKMADYLVDLGPEGGRGGGRIVACGSPEEVSRAGTSYTGRFLKELLSRDEGC
ncbi:MAG TPA: excinuclease ABC subunit UvrA [Candidatus Omnitrophota bacterium]|jgi:excinuclease ABC subunit A|nr:MAG: UvrABC system protein A [Candidatus Omnitrophica bacterium ADurb.Bin314]HOE69159.1 excinuclease ABC subunit UvrA [Candidatus Omnitrophota bacterium]HQB93911.1 excinuclease ABC subunit UvrA [Candidatus Omnitrophota bacterium]